jgi:hypothetical protein
VSAGDVSDAFSATVAGAVRGLTTAGAFRGAMAAAAFGAVRVGSMQNALLLAGASFGDDGLFGGTGTAADTFGPGSIARLHVLGSVNDSVIGAGLDPVNGVLDDGDDAVVGGAASALGPVLIGGPLNAGSLVAAGAFASVRVDGATVDPATDGRFLVG